MVDEQAPWLKLSSWKDHGAPWQYVIERLFEGNENAGQGSDGFHPVAMAMIRKHDGEYIEAIIGDEVEIDRAIAALTILKQKLRLTSLRKEVSQTERHINTLQLQVDN